MLVELIFQRADLRTALAQHFLGFGVVEERVEEVFDLGELVAAPAGFREGDVEGDL